MKAKNRGAGLHGKKNGALFGDVSRAARAVDRKCRIPPAADIASHLRESFEAASRAGTARGTISESLNALRNGFAVTIHAGHHHDAAIPPIIGGRKNPAVPKGEDRAISGFINLIKVGIADRLPPHRPSDDADDNEADPADQPGFPSIQTRYPRAASPSRHVPFASGCRFYVESRNASLRQRSARRRGTR